MSSLAGKTAMNNFSTYGATKSFVSMLSNCLAREYRNVDFLDFTPSKVSTAMNKYMPTNKFTVTADQAAEWALIDLSRGYTQSEGHPKHKIQALAMRSFAGLFNLIWEKIELPKIRKERDLPPPQLHNK